MEKAVDEEKATLAEAIGEARRHGEVAEPSDLVAYITGLQNPIIALQDLDQSHGLFDAFRKDFPFINRPWHTRAPIQPAEMNRYAALIRWILQELRGWNQGGDLENRRLVAILVATQSCDAVNSFWRHLPDEAGENVDFLDRIQEIVASFSVSYTAPGPDVPIWESEVVENLVKAEEEGDWVGIMEGWKKFPPSFPTSLHVQSVRSLNRYSFDRLLDAVAGFRQIAGSMYAAGALSIEQRLRLGLASENPYIQLAATCRALSTERGEPQNLDSEQQDLLTELLAKAAGDPPRWTAWMRIFNTFPGRLPALQRPLGRALAQAPNAALAAYIDAIWLVPTKVGSDLGRRSVAECLGEFRAHASPEPQTFLWSYAHAHWLRWDFNRADANQHSTEIYWSNLDYPVTAYACECMDSAGRKATLEALILQMCTLEDSWHASVVEFNDELNRLLSKFQPYAHACSISESGGDWLAQNRTYTPFSKSKDPYTALKYGVSS